MVFFFIHCDFRLSSWYDPLGVPRVGYSNKYYCRDYFIATGVIYITSLLYSQLRTYLKYGFGQRARLSLATNGSVRVSIPVDFSWTPGQHVFIRFLTLGLHSLTAHPFSICSLPALLQYNGPSELVFYIRPRGGFTSRLAKIASKQPNVSLPVLLDGPYGGLNATTLTKFDKALIIAGGSGAGYTLPLIEDVVRRLDGQHDTGSEEKGISLRPRQTVLQVIVSTREHDTRRWYHEAINQLLSRYPTFSSSNSLHVSVYFTGASSLASSDLGSSPPFGTAKGAATSDDDGYGDSGRSCLDLPSTTKSNFLSRPDLPSIIQETTSNSGTSVGIAVCGPAGMLQDVRNSAAAAQTSIIGFGSRAKDVYLHTEHFSYVPISPLFVNINQWRANMLDRSGGSGLRRQFLGIGGEIK